MTLGARRLLRVTRQSQEAQERDGLRLGTVLSLQEDRLFDSLWDGLLHVSAFDRIGAPPPAPCITCR